MGWLCHGFVAVKYIMRGFIFHRVMVKTIDGVENLSFSVGVANFFEVFGLYIFNKLCYFCLVRRLFFQKEF